MRDGVRGPVTAPTSKRRWQIRAAALVIVAVAAVVGAGVTLPSPSSPGRPDQPQAVTAPTTPAGVRGAAEQLYAQIVGTPEQRNAGYVLRAYAFNGATDRCMDEAGYPDWDFSRSRRHAEPLDALASGTWFARPRWRRWSERLRALKPFMDAEEEMNGGELGTPAYRDALDGCLAGHDQVSDAEADAVTTPEGAPELEALWWEELRAAAAELAGSDTPYYECMDRAKLPVLVENGFSADDLDMAMSTVMPAAADVPGSATDPAADSQAWRRFLLTEKRVIEADWQCRKGVHDQHIIGLGAFVAEFRHEHADALGAASSGWKDIEARARDLGYRGQVGPSAGEPSRSLSGVPHPLAAPPVQAHTRR